MNPPGQGQILIRNRYLSVDPAQRGWANDEGTAATRLTEFALDGKIVYDEEILSGLEQAPGAIARLYRGENQGKLIIAVD